MAESLFNKVYNPDVLSCLANLSNDEVFTPPEIVNQMLDLLPQELFQNPDTTFLDPACKTGVFLREIAKRLIKGLEPQFPDLQERIDHIFHRQLFGIAITELTSLLSRRGLYCSKYPNSEFSVSRFDTAEGNIRYKRIPHTWKDGRCIYCGASQKEYDRAADLETHAYEFIHTLTPEKLFDMKFDVIIGNPPYQLSDGGNGASAKPIYHMFVEQAKKMKPRYLSMIIPARWYAGGKGLDEFRGAMLNDRSIQYLTDYFDSNECFPGVDLSGGVCYFLWNRDYKGDCIIESHRLRKITKMQRPLLMSGNDNFIRFNEAVPILEKVQSRNEDSLSSLISARKPFGLETNAPLESASSSKGKVLVYSYGRTGYISETKITQHQEWIDKIKVCISYAYGERGDVPYQVIGKPFILPRGCCCTETYLVVSTFDDECLAHNLCAYLMTKFVRFLVLLRKNTQHATSKVYSFVPMQDFSKPWTDEELYQKYNLSQEEIDFIESMIKPME